MVKNNNNNINMELGVLIKNDLVIYEIFYMCIYVYNNN